MGDPRSPMGGHPEQSRIVGEPDEALVRHVLRGSLGLDVERIVLAPRQGTVNWTFRATTPDRSFAVRFHRIRSADEAAAEYARERWCTEAARGVGIPAPQVLRVGRSHDRAWMIQEWAEGRAAPETPGTYRRLGDYARRLAGETTEPDRSLFPGPFPDPAAGWRGQVSYNLEQLHADDPLIALGVYASADRARLREAFEALRASSFRVALQHGDLSPANLIVRENGAPVLVDWGCAAFDVTPWQPINDLRRLRLETGAPSADCLRGFVEGMGLGWEACRAMEPVLNRWLLLKATDLVRWALDRCPARVGALGRAARRVVDAYLSDRLPLDVRLA